MKYKIIDWAYHRLFPNKTFNCIDTAWYFVGENCEGEKDEYGDIRHDDIFIVPSNTRCYHQGYWSTSN